MKHPSDYIARSLRSLCTRLAAAIEARASKVDGPARVAMEQVAVAVRELK